MSGSELTLDTAESPSDVESHIGRPEQFLLRYENLVARLLTAGPEEIRRIYPRLLRWIADPRSLHEGWRRGLLDGGGAAGPNGRHRTDLSKRETFRLLALVSRDLLGAEYHPGPTKRVWIPKDSGLGIRPIQIPDVEDDAVFRSITQIVWPLLEPWADERSFCRRHHGPLDALAHADALVRTGKRPVWICDDIRDFFQHIPHGRLMDALRKALPVPDVLNLISRVISNDSGKGIDMGAATSPMLANHFLGTFVDRRWRRLHPTVPLLRFLDDLLVVCGSDDDPAVLYADLQRIVREAGLTLKGSPDDSIVNLANGAFAEWLGYRVELQNGELVVALPGPESAKHWVPRLTAVLSRAFTVAQPSLQAVRVLRNFVDHAAPCYHTTDRQLVYEQIITVAEEVRFREIPRLDNFMAAWRKAFLSWKSIREQAYTDIRNGQRSDRQTRPTGRRRGPTRTWIPLRSDELITIYTDGCCLPRSKTGGWACIFFVGAHQERIRRGGISRTTNNRMELTAVIAGLETLSGRCCVRVVSDSRYVVDGINVDLPRWKRQSWRSGSPGHTKPLKNADLWRKLDQLLQQHDVTCHWTPGHADDAANESCDRLARRQARQTETTRKAYLVTNLR